MYFFVPCLLRDSENEELRCQSVVYDFKPLLRDTAVTQLTYSALFFKYNAPGISEMTRSTFHRSTSSIFFKNGDKKLRIQP